MAILLLLFVLTPVATIGWLVSLLFLVFLVLFSYASIALILIAFRRTFLHCEQIHLCTNGFVAIDPRGRRQGALGPTF